ncbi:hypothetical protein A4S06_08310 [Erysipelotrichaceae bacterium MTC7]|nr:hypothetical protein A4S06_08310 [Erysipelotrichaceae bacterium MTC7]
MDKQRSFFSNFMWNSVGSFIYLFCQWLLSVIVLRLSNDFNNSGNLALAMSVTNIFYSVAVFNIRPYLVSDKNGEYKSGDYVFLRILTCTVALLLCMSYSLFFDYTLEQYICIFVYMMFKVVEATFDLLSAFGQRQSRMDIAGKSMLIRGFLCLGSFAFFLKLSDSVSIAIVSMVAVSLVFMFIYDYPQVRMLERLKPSFDFKVVFVMLKKLYPLAVSQFLLAFALIYPRQVLEVIKGTEALGIYATVATPTVIVQVAASYVFNPLLTLFTNQLYERRLKNFSNTVMKTSLIIAVLSIFAIIVAMFVGSWGLTLLYGQKIASYTDLLIPVLIATCLNAFVAFTNNIIIICRKLKSLLVVNVIGVIVALLASRPIISEFGMYGVSYVLIIMLLVVNVLSYAIIVFFIKQQKHSQKLEVGE